MQWILERNPILFHKFCNLQVIYNELFLQVLPFLVTIMKSYSIIIMIKREEKQKTIKQQNVKAIVLVCPINNKTNLSTFTSLLSKQPNIITNTTQTDFYS